MGASVVAKIGEALEPEVWQASKDVLAKTEAGKYYVNLMRTKVEPEIAKLTETLRGGGTPVHEVMGKARNDVKQAVFGKNDINFTGLLRAVEKQGGPSARDHLANFHDIYFKQEAPAWRQAVTSAKAKAAGTAIDVSRQSPYTAPGVRERTLKTVSQETQLGTIAIPHLAQAPLNAAVLGPVSKAISAAAEYMKDPASARAWATKVGAMAQENVYEQMRVLAKDKPGAMGMLAKAQPVLDPLRGVFEWSRRMGIGYSSVWGRSVAEEAADKFFTSGGQDKVSEMHLKMLLGDGAGAKVMSQRGKLLDADRELAAFRASSELMGYRSLLETPMSWDRNAAWRIGTMYKPYSYRTMQIHKDALVKSWQAGGMRQVAKQVAVYGTLFPVAGELIKIGENAVTLQNPHDEEHEKRNILHGSVPAGVDDYLDAMGVAMTMGMLHSSITAATHRRLANFFIGPVPNAAVDLGEGLAAKHAFKQTSKSVLRRAGLPGRIANSLVFPTKK